MIILVFLLCRTDHHKQQVTVTHLFSHVSVGQKTSHNLTWLLCLGSH